MNERLLRIINERQLSSIMNNTKWRELATSIQSIKDFNPLVREKYLGEKEGLRGFSHYDWECLRLGSSSEIEWLEVDPIIKHRRGKLIEDEKVDHSETIASILKKHSIPYSLENKLFKIRGYTDANNQPNFV